MTNGQHAREELPAAGPDRRTGRRGPEPTVAHGTASGARRHYRNGEKPCEACRQAMNAYAQDRQHSDVFSSNCRPAPRPWAVNGLPEEGGYAWRARARPWAEAILRRVEAVLGAPPAGAS